MMGAGDGGKVGDGEQPEEPPPPQERLENLRRDVRGEGIGTGTETFHKEPDDPS